MKLKNEHNLPPQIKDTINSLLDAKVSVYHRQSFYNRLKDIKDNVDEAIKLFETELAKTEKRYR